MGHVSMARIGPTENVLYLLILLSSSFNSFQSLYEMIVLYFITVVLLINVVLRMYHVRKYGMESCLLNKSRCSLWCIGRFRFLPDAILFSSLIMFPLALILYPFSGSQPVHRSSSQETTVCKVCK